MRIDKTLVVVLLIILATAIANAEDLEPTVQITSNPELNATSSAVITIIATDLLENAGIEKIDFYINGAWEYTKQCGASTCTLTRTIVKTQPAFEIYKAIATDKGGNIGISPLINISYRGVNSPPTITTLPNITILEDSGMNGNLTDLWQYASDTWTEDSNLVYSIISQTNTSMANCLIDANRYINCTTVTGNATGFTNITISVSDGIFVKNSTFSLEVENVNDLPELIQPIPNLSLNEDTSNLTINLSQYFKDIDGPSIEYEFISNTTALNAFVVNISGTLFLNLSSNNNYNGQQNLTIIANDSLNQTNTTIIVTVFPVNDAPYFNPSLQNQTAIQDILFAYDINASDIDQGDILTYTDNSSLFTIDPSTGLISFTPLISGNRTVNITVCDDSGEPNDCTNEIFNLEIIYIPRPGFGNSTPLNATYTETAYYELFIDIINSSTIDTVLFEFNNANITAAQVSGNRYKTNLTNLPVGAYNYRWHANYTNTLSNSSILYTFTILPATTILTLNAPNATIVYGIKTNINCTSNTQQAIPTLYQNGTATTNPEITQLPAGSYNYTCSVPATQNYTTAEQTAYFNINKANTTMTLNAPITEAYGTTTNINCSINNNQSTLQLLRDGNPVVNPEITQLAAGYYNYTCNAPESQNYTAVIQTKFVNITKQTTTLILNVPSSAVYGTTTNANYTTNNNQATIQFLRDGNPVANPEIIQLGAGNYNYTCDIPETQNYTSARQTNFLTITQQTPVLGLYLNGTDANFYDKINTTVFLNGTINL
ncbi:hypothetical protein JW851_04325, partial [Candidatus Woesearchaeota archaeon]|nr:hypothetical protein [Candidatus Woesearchaeota archaeon]